MKKKKKKKSNKTWQIPPIAKNDRELQKQIDQIFSFAAVARGCNTQKKYDVAYEFMTRVYEVADIVLRGMEELPPEKR